MERRDFLRTCAILGGTAGLTTGPSIAADAPPRLYARTRLVDIHGVAIGIDRLAPDTNYVFNYPYVSTPCFLLKLSRRVARNAEMRRQDGAKYTSPGGIGPGGNLVAFSAICAHKLAYPTRDVSFIRFQKDRSATTSGDVIHCCADHSVYDPAAGARVVAGPAPQPLAGIVLEYAEDPGELYAVGTIGPEQFDAFFEKYAMKLALEYGDRRARAAAADTAVVRELESYCKTTIRC